MFLTNRRMKQAAVDKWIAACFIYYIAYEY